MRRMPRPGRVREGRDARARLALEARAERAEDAGARQEAVHQHDHVVARAALGHDGREIARHQRDLAQQREPLDADELLQRDRESHLRSGTKHDPCARRQLSA